MINNIQIAEVGFKDPYQIVHNFINEFIIPKYDNLIRCDRFNRDELGNPAVEFFIRYCPDISFDQEKKLYFEIISQIREFCSNNNILDIFSEITVFVTVAGDCSGYH